MNASFMKTKIVSAITMAIVAFAASAGVQVTTMKKELIPNTTNILVGVEFNEDDPVFTNWVESAQFRQIPRMTSEKYRTEYEPGKTNVGNRTKFFVGNTSSMGEITKDTIVLDVYDIHDKLVLEVPDNTVTVYKCEYVDRALSNKCDKVDLTSIEPLTPSSSVAEIVTAVKALANALGNNQ